MAQALEIAGDAQVWDSQLGKYVSRGAPVRRNAGNVEAVGLGRVTGRS